MSGLQQYEGVLIFHTSPCLHKEQKSEKGEIRDFRCGGYGNNQFSEWAAFTRATLLSFIWRFIFFLNIHN
jgi:hypothetical protein